MNVHDIKIELPKIDLENNSILKISIKENWTSSDFSLLFRSLDIIYRSKFWTYKAILDANNFLTNPENKNITFIHSIHTPLWAILHSIRTNLRLLEEDTFSRHIKTPPTIKSKFVTEQLIVKKMQYASPGFTDFLGIAGILKEIKEAITYYFPNAVDKEKYEVAKQQRIELQIKNLKSIGFSDIEIRTLLLREDVKLETISKFIEQGLVSNVEITDSKN